MVDRASTFSDPEIVELLRTKFVPLAVDEWYLTRQKDAEGEFFRKVITQEVTRTDMNNPTQGLYAFDAAGKLYGFTNHGAERLARLKKLLADTLREFRPDEAARIDIGRKDVRYLRTPPEGGLVVEVTAKKLSPPGSGGTDRDRLLYDALGQDRLWIRKDEAAALAGGSLPESVKRRLARFHLFDTTAGRLDAWGKDDVRKLDLAFETGVVRGKVEIENASGDAGFKGEIFGRIEARDGRVTRFDLVARGRALDKGGYAYSKGGAPKGEYALAVSFRLVAGKDESFGVPPTGMRVLSNGYLD